MATKRVILKAANIEITEELLQRYPKVDSRTALDSILDKEFTGSIDVAIDKLQEIKEKYKNDGYDHITLFHENYAYDAFYTIYGIKVESDDQYRKRILGFLQAEEELKYAQAKLNAEKDKKKFKTTEEDIKKAWDFLQSINKLQDFQTLPSKQEILDLANSLHHEKKVAKVTKRESFTFSEEDARDAGFDFTGSDSVEINGEEYDYFKKFRTNGDGEWTAVIYQRASDGKLFRFSWGYYHDNYYYEGDWEEYFESDGER